MNEIQLSAEEYRAILRNDFATFIERSFSELNPQQDFIPGGYIELLAATLERCRTGQTTRQIVTLPPRTLKSHAASVALPAFFLGHDPTKQIICVSYGQELAEKHARDCRTVMSSAFYHELFPRTVLSSQKSSVYDFMTTLNGGRMATSVGGVLTGRGADIIILDDPLKPTDALSETARTAANDWYFNTLLSRLNSKRDGVIILVMQRLHQQDLVGAVMDRGAWEVLSLPAIAVHDESYPIKDFFGSRSFSRESGEALHPERDSLATYLSIKEAIGEFIYQSQYQQDPGSRAGGVIKREWIKYYSEEERPTAFHYVFQSWDTACKGGEANDYSVCTTWGLLYDQFYLLDVIRKRLTFPDLKRAACDNFKRFPVDKVLIEDRASGISLLQELLHSGEIWCLEPYKPPAGTDKLVRLSAQSIKFERGCVYLPQQVPWLDEYVKEITGFPGCAHDDQVDSTTQALDILGTLASPESARYFGGVSRGYESW